MTSDDADLADWLELAEEVARRHRQGQVLGTDPVLVLRGLPPMWRRAASSGGPADDVVALAGAALERIEAGDAELRPPLVEAAAGCLGSDLPALLRQLRPVLAARQGEGPVCERHDPGGPPEPDQREPVRRNRPRPGQRLALAGGLGALALAVVGGAAAWPTSTPPADIGPDTDPVATTLTARPTALDGEPMTTLAWQRPHLVVEVAGTRYRYRLDGDVEAVAVARGADRATVIVTAAGERWELAVPALDATGPGRTGS